MYQVSFQFKVTKVIESMNNINEYIWIIFYQILRQTWSYIVKYKKCNEILVSQTLSWTWNWSKILKGIRKCSDKMKLQVLL